MKRVVLLGDSILDNRSYTAPEPDTAFHLQEFLGGGWAVELHARDGAVMAGIAGQVDRLPADVDVAIVSIGGNDATSHLHLLEPRTGSSVEQLGQLRRVAKDFAAAYAECLALLRKRVQRLVACTIYEVPLDSPARADLARVPLSLLNDQIIRAAASAGAEVLDLRFVCDEPADYVLQIEPSARGARKIARAIAHVVRDQDGLAATRFYRGW